MSEEQLPHWTEAKAELEKKYPGHLVFVTYDGGLDQTFVKVWDKEKKELDSVQVQQFRALGCWY